jgi:hypothetical protein
MSAEEQQAFADAQGKQWKVDRRLGTLVEIVLEISLESPMYLFFLCFSLLLILYFLSYYDDASMETPFEQYEISKIAT